MSNSLQQLSWDWRKILEVLILGQFVIDKVIISHMFQDLLKQKITSMLSIVWN